MSKKKFFVENFVEFQSEVTLEAVPQFTERTPMQKCDINKVATQKRTKTL